MSSEAPLGALASEAGRACVGYRWPGGGVAYRPPGVSREWVEARARGEFVWPVVAVGEWLAARAAGEALLTRAKGSDRALGRAVDAVITASRRPETAAQPRRSLVPLGGR